MKIVAIGDSLTFGYGVNKDDNFVELLRKNHKYQIVNKGKNGDSTAGILSRFYKDVVETNCSLCIIMAGTNDIFSGRKAKYVSDNIIEMVNECKLNNIIPLVLSPPKTFATLAKIHWYSDIDYCSVNNLLGELSSLLQLKCEKEMIKFINIYDFFPCIQEHYTDGVHISPKGYKLIYTEIEKEIAILL